MDIAGDIAKSKQKGDQKAEDEIKSKAQKAFRLWWTSTLAIFPVKTGPGLLNQY